MNSAMRDAHDLGLNHDLLTMAAQLRARRRVLGMMLGGGATALVAGCGGGSSNAIVSTSGTGGTSGSCLADSQETNGPYPSDGSNSANGVLSNSLLNSGVVRSDIRSSFGGITGTAGDVPLTLNIT